MNRKQKAEARAAWAAQHERQALWESSPLPASEKIQLKETARYLAACLKGEVNATDEPPAHWSAEQRAEWVAVMADEQAISAALTWMLEGWQQLQRETAQLNR